ncbi:DUF6895 family protein [Kitasatospora purpeofusca]|uniref:DUF6895 family protein n=1 Tax=Kitasatospora purpeofusca TaxID=67352 RepID=UPI002A5A6D11|nr:hypothetical protein [Kitasatospora purpeofusca]MDY0816298.1 hypothetical protein [Kitasatospora purpeofusca]
MGTRSAAPDLAAVESLSAGARRWIGRHCGLLDEPAGRAELPVTPRVKALLQLALLYRCWARAAGATGPEYPAHPARAAAPDPDLAAVAATVEQVWRSPAHPPLLTVEPRYARQFQLMYGALAPAGLDADGPHRAALAEGVAGDLLTPRRKSPFLHLETRYYAELAEVPHQLLDYPELYRISRLAGHADGQPLAELDVCDVTHTVFHLSDFGFRDPGLGGADLAHARDRVERLTEESVRRGEWDLTGKLVLAQHCLGLDPLATPSGAAGLRLLAEAQSPEGAFPGRSATDRVPADATAVQSFRKSYQSTLVVALATVILLRPRSGTAGERPPTLSAAPALGGAR